MVELMKKSCCLLLCLILCLCSAAPVYAADGAFQTGLAYLLAGSSVYADTSAQNPLFQVTKNAPVYVLENATGSGKTIKSNDMLKVTISLNSQAQDVYVWAYDVEYMSKRDIARYTPGAGTGVYGIILENVVTADAATPQPAITRRPDQVRATPEPTQAPAPRQAQPTPAPRQAAVTATPKPATPTPVPATPTPAPVFAAFIAVQPEAAVGQIGLPVTLSVLAENAVGYQWQFKEADKDFMNLPNNEAYAGSREADMTFTLTEENAGWTYRCVVSGVENTVISEAVGVTLSTALAIISQPTDAVAAPGGQAVFTVEAANAVAWSWQMETADDEWAALTAEQAEGADTATVTVQVTDALRGAKLRCQLTGAEGDEAVTNTVSIVTGAAARIIKQPEDVTAANGSQAVLHVEAENAISYQWQYDDGISGWWDLVERDDRIGTTTDTLTLMVRPTVASFTFRCVITGAENTIETRTVTLKIR